VDRQGCQVVRPPHDGGSHEADRTAENGRAQGRGGARGQFGHGAAQLDSLKKLKGAEFDQAYIQQIGLAGHKEALEAFNKEASDGVNRDLKEAARKALPTIQEHYSMAQELAKKKGVPAR
jgi:hypothetical protein